MPAGMAETQAMLIKQGHRMDGIPDQLDRTSVVHRTRQCKPFQDPAVVQIHTDKICLFLLLKQIELITVGSSNVTFVTLP